MTNEHDLRVTMQVFWGGVTFLTNNGVVTKSSPKCSWTKQIILVCGIGVKEQPFCPVLPLAVD